MRALLLAVCLLCNSWGASAQAVMPVPALSARVIDQTATLDNAQTAALSAQLEQIETRYGTQIAVLMVATTQPEDIFSYAQRVAGIWKIGRKSIGDGVLIVVAKDDRKLRIEIAKTLEGAIPDLAASYIVRDTMAPLFKQSHYAQGLQDGIEQLRVRIAKEDLPAPAQGNVPAKSAGVSGIDIDPLQLLLFGFFAIPVIASLARGILGNKLGVLATGAVAGGIAWLLTASLLLAAGVAIAALILALVSGIKGLVGSGRRSGYTSGTGYTAGYGTGGRSSWGGSSGGGFSSGGGGDFGGGGASGDW